MSEAIDFINKNSGLFSLLFSFVVALATLAYVILTWLLVRETKFMREAQTEPRISIAVHSKEEWLGFLDMMIQNIGLGPAYDIRFETDFNALGELGIELKEVNVLRNGLNYLAPSQKVSFFFTSLMENHDQKIKLSFRIKTSYRSSAGKIYRDEYQIDLAEFKGLSRIGEPHLYKIATYMERIQKDIHNLTTGFSKISTLIYTPRDIRKQREETIKAHLELQKKQEKTVPGSEGTG